jgi:hypothetical protein
VNKGNRKGRGLLQKPHATTRTSKIPAKYIINAHDTKSATPPTHIITRGTAAGIASCSIACRIVSDKGCAMNLLSILVSWTIGM